MHDSLFGVVGVTIGEDVVARFREPKTVYEERALVEKVFVRLLNVKTNKR